jgi:hypothetical protein
MPVAVSITPSCDRQTTVERTVSLDPELPLRYLFPSCVYVCVVVCKGYDMADFELIFVVVEHEVTESVMR